jgi:glycosyltransferase involved in cell wall biosynthesis
MKKQKIGIDIRAIGQQRTGDEYYTLNLVQNLLKIDKENQYFLFTDTRKTKKIEKKILGDLKNKNFKIVSVTPRFKLIWTLFLLPLYAKKMNLDVLHVQYIAPIFLSKKIKLVATIADVSFKKYPKLINKIDLFFLNSLIPLSLKRANEIIAVSNFTKEEIVKYFKISKKKIKVVYNGGVGKEFFEEKTKNKKALDKIGITQPYLFYAGTHQPRKDIPTLMKAFFNLKLKNDKFKDLKLVIGGKLKAHNYDSRIDELIVENKNNPLKKDFLKDLIFTGYLESNDLVKLYREAEVFVFPSLYEGFGLPLVEAMASGTPVVCSNIDCFKEIGGQAVEFYEKANPSDLTNKLTEIINNSIKKEQMTKKGERQAQKYSWEKTANETLNIFTKNFY